MPIGLGELLVCIKVRHLKTGDGWPPASGAPPRPVMLLPVLGFHTCN
jgi:hypothetical protein